MEKKKNSGLLVGLLLGIIIMLVVFICLFATGTVSFKTATTSDKGQNSANNQSNTNDINNTEYDAENIAKEKMPVAISLINQERNAGSYCGGFENNDMIEVDVGIKDLIITMDASSKFKTLNELKEHLKNNLSEELIDKYFKEKTYNEYYKTNINNYLEKNGKLYCRQAHKGYEWLYIRNEDKINEGNPIVYTIINKNDNSFDVKVEAKYGLMGSTEQDQLVKINATITKINDNWIVTKYEEQ